jgi:multiple antibiotic resistance protein
MTSFLLVFIPIFVAIDAIGNISTFLTLTSMQTRDEKRRLAIHATLTAFVVGIVCGFGGHVIFRVLGITPGDFQIAGGLLLLILSIREILGAPNKGIEVPSRDKWIGVVPLGIPFIAGPALITTILILHETHSHMMLIAALAANLAIVLALLSSADAITERLGEAFSRGTAKVIAIFLAAIGVMMIRRGLEALLAR